TSSDVIEAYLMVRAALALSPYLGTSTDAWKAQRTLVEFLTGIKKGAVGDRAEHCVRRVEEALGFGAGRFFVNRTFAGESREKGTKVITNIVKAFEKSLKNIDWMDEESAKAAEEKACNLNILSASISDEFKSWNQLGKQRDPESWEMCPSMVNAYFNPPANEARILQPPFFQKKWPGYLSYGAFGRVAAHELTVNCIIKKENWSSAYTIDDGKGGKVHVN
ncbi:hypothetical protein MPER_03916, partial [Moniliophthora perniciosa FA553]